MSKNSPASGTPETPYVVLVLQGGGALGAYHIGAYQALCEAGYSPDWITGVSIGSINAAILAGTPPEQRLSRLETFWDTIARPSFWDSFVPSALRRWYNAGSAMQALLFGQPGFSWPYFINPYLAPAGTPAATSFYDNTPLRLTVEEMTDFDLINAQQVRLSLGVTKVTTGNLVFFDNTSESDRPIGAEHVIASSSIPPLFPATRVKGELYWDGGIVDNTPLDPVLAEQDRHPERHTLVFMIDLWDGSGPEPRTMDEVLWRQNQIQFASRTDRHIREIVERENLRRALGSKAAAHPTAPPAFADPTFQDGTLFAYGNLDIVRITYHPRSDETALSYLDFSHLSIAERRSDGYADMKLALSAAPWLITPPRGEFQLGAPVVGEARRLDGARAAFHHVTHGEIHSQAPGT